MLPKFFLLIGFTFILQMAPSSPRPQFSQSLYDAILAVLEEQNREPIVPLNRTIFATNLFKQISKARTNENIIISPLSVQASLGMVYLGAQENTASELVYALYFESDDKEDVGKIFKEILNKNNGETELTIANRLFVRASNKLRLTFNNQAKEYYNSEPESLNFNKQSDAIEAINSWVEEETNKKITHIFEQGSLDPDTSAVLVNAISFKGNWKNAFSKRSTTTRRFWVSPTKSVQVETMYNVDDSFKYVHLPDLDSKAIELPYEGSNISMVIILPNQHDGLANLEKNLTTAAFHKLNNARKEDVNVLLPRFKVEFSVGLVDTLKELGIRSLFEDSANLSGIFQSGPGVKISNIQHKAVIDVDEAGSDAPAPSFRRYGYPMFRNPVEFDVDHPFVFAIKSVEDIYFIGHIATL